MRKASGIILISTLLLVFFLVLLATAFVNINTNNLRLATNVRNQELATLAAMSGAQYARLRLEQYLNSIYACNSWGGYRGGAGFGNNPTPACPSAPPPPANQYLFTYDFDSTAAGNQGAIPAGIGSGVTITEDSGTGLVRGILAGNEASFRIAFTNNPLTSSSAAGGFTTPTSFNNLMSEVATSRSGGLRTVPAGNVHLIVVGQAGGVERTVEVLFKRTALTDSSAFARGDLSVTIASPTATDHLWYLNSVDPFDNTVRASEGKVKAPPLGNSAAITNPVPAFDASSLGLTFTGGKKPTAGTGSGTAIDPAGSQLGAIVAGTTIEFGPPGPSQVVIGDASPNETDETTYVKQQTGGVLHPGTASPKPPDLTAANFTPDSSTKCIYGLTNGTYTITASNQVQRGGVNQAAGPNGTINLAKVAGPPTCTATKDIYIKDYMLRIPNDVNVRVPGDFTLELSPLLATDKRGKLGLGFNASAAMSTGTPPNFHAQGGNMVISGEVTGTGSMVAQQSGLAGGALTIEGRSVLSTDPTQGVAVYADQNINLNPISSTALSGGNTDYTAYKNAIVAQNTAEGALEQATAYGSGYVRWLHNWGNSYSGNTTNTLNLLRTKSVGTATYNVVTDKTIITVTGGGTVSVSGNQMANIEATNTALALPPGSAALEWYVRLKQVETGGDTDWLNPAEKTASDVNSTAQGRLDTFWSDRSNIESQLKSTLESGTGPTKFNDNTAANANTYCSGCTNYENYKDNSALVGFPDYWQYSAANQDPTGGALGKFGGAGAAALREDRYKTNFGAYWDSSPNTAAQTLSPQDGMFTGVIYTKGDFTASMGANKFFVEGAIVAPGSAPAGNITITGKKVQFLYNPAYLTKFVNPAGSTVRSRLTQVFWVMW